MRPRTSPRGIFCSRTSGCVGPAAAGPAKPIRATKMSAGGSSWHGKTFIFDSTSAQRLPTYRSRAVLALLDVHLIQSRAQSFGQPLCVVIGPKMHEEEARFVIQHVIVECRHFDAVLAQGAEHRIHLLCCEHKVAGNRCLAAPCWLEV